ncbi:peptidase S8 [Paraclostridium bifermentans]|uniref:bile acid germinant receptor pseudoprotease CspC n=1 Tax=Paraclostridium bifermentans TaxID=1490 RepID=UPI0021C28960|nr:bile acid germinant receptor pseudoprotease CspC [Paraclostridium bifermentans]GKZ06269.1 peptidase S8 [Paraclostridium bifermentans]GKZ09357.1 peptidase S8 [Paraclostridium bifermentans]
MKSYIITYNGEVYELKNELESYNINKYAILNEKLATIYVDEFFDEKILNKLEFVYDWMLSIPVSSLIEISDNNDSKGARVRELSEINYIDRNPYIDVFGSGNAIAIIDSGIDYMHPDFINKDGSSKIIAIWDQDNDAGNTPENLNFGSEFTRKDINEYIKMNSYELTKDTEGTGTIAAGIACGNGNLNSQYKGVAPKSELLIVKLRAIKDVYKKGTVGYELSDFLAGISYVVNFIKKYNKNLILNLTVSERSESIILTNFLDTFNELKRPGNIVVSGMGNEGNTDIHCSGKFTSMEEVEDVIIQIGNQENLDISVSCIGPYKISATLISPSGEYSYPIQYSPDENIYNGTFNIEKTKYSLRYIYPWIKSGTEEILIKLKNVKPGMWTLRLKPEFIITGEYDVYLPNQNLIDKDTRFVNSNYFSTTNIFAATENVISIGGFNNEIDSMWLRSSIGTFNQVPLKPDIVAPCVNIVGPYKEKTYVKASGTGVSSSIVTGVVSILVDFLVSQSNLNQRLIYTDIIKTYLMIGADRFIYKYPNIRMGYGVLNLRNTIQQISQNLR